MTELGKKCAMTTPKIMAYLNGVRVKRFADLSLFFVKIVGTILSVSSSLAIGPEGPLVHLGAIIGAFCTKSSHLVEFLVHRFHHDCPSCGNVLGCATPKKMKLDDDDEEKDEWPPESARERENCSSCSCGNSAVSRFAFHLRYFCKDEERRDLISIGAASGFAAAFGAPIGGLLFSLEEASSFFTRSLLWKTLTATAIATFCLALYHGNLASYGVILLETGGDSPNGDRIFINRFVEMPLYVCMGIGGGLLGALFNGTWKMMFRTRRAFFAREHIGRRGRNVYRLAEVAVLSLLTSVLMFCLPLMLSGWACREIGSGRWNENLAADEDGSVEGEGSYHRLNCPRGQVNELGSVLFGSRDEAIKHMLMDPAHFDPRTLFTVGALFYPLYLITFGVSIPAGIFMPTVLVGSSFGAFAGTFFQHRVSSDIAPSTFGVLGAAALLSGVQRNTVSLCVILVEGTGQVKVLIPVIVTVVVARYVGDLINHGVYHEAIHLKHYPYLDHRVKKTLDILKVSDVMSCPVRVIMAVETAGSIEEILLESNHHGFPVVDPDTHKFLGLVRRDQLVALLECGIFMENEANGDLPSEKMFCKPSPASSPMARQFLYQNNHSLRESVLTDYHRGDLFDDSYDEHAWFVENVHATNRTITLAGEDSLPRGRIRRRAGRLVKTKHGKLIINLAPEDRKYHVDVGAIMNQGAYVVTERCPLSKAYGMFTALGLRYLVVLGGECGGNVVGIISRGNLNNEFIQRRTGCEL